MTADADIPAPARSVVAAAAVAVALLLGSGIGHRQVAHYLSRPSGEAALAAGALAKLPLSIGSWSGRDVPLDASVIRATDTDAHVHRTYDRGRTSVGLFVAYGIRTRDLAPHRPEVCYPGAGWTLQQAEPTRVSIDDASVLPCTVYRFSRGGKDRHVTVLNYYIIDGRVCPDVSALRRRAWRGPGGVRYLAQVQITCSGDMLTDEAAAEAATVAFARVAAPQIRALFPDAVGETLAGGS